MTTEYAVPISIALLGLLLYIDSSHIFEIISENEYRWHNADSIRARMKILGKDEIEGYESFRIAQMVFMLAAIAFLTALCLFNAISTATAIVLSLSISVVVVILTERNLTRRSRKRVASIEGEFPAVVQLLALAVGAGESPAMAMRRISHRGSGYLAQHFGRVINEIESGKPLSQALDEMSKSMELSSIRRFSDSIAISISRGTPLTETLLHAADESRSAERNKILEAASKSEISMMIPIVFLILPISILFALYPSLTNLNLFA